MIVKRSLGYARAFPGLAAGTLLALLSGAGLAMAGPLIVHHVIDDGIAARHLSRAGWWSLAYLALELVRAGVEASQNILLRAFSQATAARIRKDVFDHLQRLPLRWFDEGPAGEIAARSTNEVATLGEALSAGLAGFFRDVLVLVLVVVLVLLLHPRFGMVVVGFSLVAGIPALVFRRAAQNRSRRALEASSRMMAVLEENLSGRSVIRLFGLERSREGRFCEANDQALDVAFSTLRMRVFFDGGATVTSAIALTVILGLGGAELAQGRISPGLFVAFVQYGAYLIGSLRGTAEKAVAVLSGVAAGERVFQTLDTPPMPAAAPGDSEERGEAGELIADGLRFGYGPGPDVIRGLSLRVKAGERIALVGKTGAGVPRP